MSLSSCFSVSADLDFLGNLEQRFSADAVWRYFILASVQPVGEKKSP